MTPESNTFVQPVQQAGDGNIDLQAILLEEFQRQGIDPDRVAMKAPSGEQNRVLDLTVTKIDADGPGGEPPTGVTLAWTEQACGDYDQNGYVDIADLTPLGQHLGNLVDYLEPVPGMPEWYPAGDPCDPGTEEEVANPLEGSGACNWRLARIDGKADGELNIADITPLVEHWHERIDGYRVYRRSPGSTEFELLQNPKDPEAPLTVPRANVRSNWPVRYSFEDPELEVGNYVYFVVPFDVKNELEGQASQQKPARLLNVTPVALLQASVIDGNAPLVVKLDASASNDPDGEIVDIEWDLDGDGNYNETETGADLLRGTATAEYTYQNGGYYEPAVRVTDDMGDQHIRSITIHVNLPPQASLEALNYSGNEDFSTELRANNSTDADGEIIKYEWDLDGDGEFGETDNGEAEYTGMDIITAPIPGHGDLITAVRVTDDDGIRDVAWVQLKVNAKPRARMHCEIEKIPEMTVVYFDASETTDPDSTDLSYRWNVVCMNPSSSTLYDGVRPGITFPHSAHYRIVLTVTDDKGAFDSFIDDFDVYRLPIAHFESDITCGRVGCTVNFNAGLSYDPDGEVVTYEWWINDETPAIDNDPEYARVFNQPGNYVVNLRVIDNDMFKSFAYQQNVYISDMTPCPFPATLNPAAWEPGAYSAANVGGLPAVVYKDKATRNLYYTRMADTTGTEWTVPVQVSNAQDAGDYCSLAVIGGVPAVAYLVNTNTSGTDVSNIEYARAADSLGATWETPATIKSQGPYITVNSLSLAGIDGQPAVAYAINSGVMDYLVYIRANDATGETWPVHSGVIAINYSGHGNRYLYDVAGLPAVFCQTADNQLVYKRATSTAGVSWNPDAVLSWDGSADSQMWFTAMLVADGNPVAFGYKGSGTPGFGTSRSDDAIGTSFSIFTEISDASSAFDAALVGGVPGYLANLGYIELHRAESAATYPFTWTTPACLYPGNADRAYLLDLDGSPAVVAVRQWTNASHEECGEGFVYMD